MSVAFIRPGVPLLYAPRQPVLWRSLPAGVTEPTGGGETGSALSAIDGLSGWWDASSLGNMLDSTGAAVPAWLGAFASLADLSGAGRRMQTYAAGGSPTAVAMPRVSALLGGAGYNAATAGAYQPALSVDLGFQVPDVEFGAGAAWTRLLVWSRPNLRQQSGKDNEAVVLLLAGRTPIMSADSGAPGSLTLLPQAAAAVLTRTLARRHTHAVILRHTPGAGIDAWLDGVQVATGITNALASTAGAPLTLLHDGTANGSAQCWFNEFATWERALTNAELGAVVTYCQRWALGTRKGVSIVINGQSNAINFAVNDGAAALMVQGIAWHLGALAWNWVGGSQETMVASHALYAGPYGGSFLNDPGDGSDPSTWSLGADGLADQAYLSAQTAADLADVGAIFWYWSESDSARAYTEKPTYKAAVQRFLALERAMLPGGTAATLPHLWWNAMPFPLGSDGGTQMIRETMNELTNTAGYDCVCVMPMTADSNGRNGDNDHLDVTDNIRLARLAAPVAARALLAVGHGDSINALPAGIPVKGGPQIVHAYRQSNTSVIVTVQQDAGTDLLLPGTAPHGTGFAVMDGGSVANPGNLVSATACARLDATHLQITLASPLTAVSSACLLFYPWGIEAIGRGNAVTDNWSTIVKPSGWDIAGDLGSAWAIDCPLAATTQPVPLSDSP